MTSMWSPTEALDYQESEHGFTVELDVRPGFLGRLKAAELPLNRRSNALQVVGFFAVLAVLWPVNLALGGSDWARFGVLLVVVAIATAVEARIDSAPKARFIVELGRLRVTDAKGRLRFEAPLHQVEIHAEPDTTTLRLTHGVEALTLDTMQEPYDIRWLAEQIRERQSMHGDEQQVPPALKALEKQRG